MQTTTISVSDTEAVFEYTFSYDSTTSDYEIYFTTGIPSGRPTSIELAPRLLTIAPNTGPFGGFYVAVTGVGFGVYSDVTADFCDSDLDITGYGQFTCYVSGNEHDGVQTLSVGSDEYDCGTDDTTACELSVV